jgi:hypothetical protein
MLFVGLGRIENIQLKYMDIAFLTFPFTDDQIKGYTILLEGEEKIT